MVLGSYDSGGANSNPSWARPAGELAARDKALSWALPMLPRAPDVFTSGAPSRLHESIAQTGAIVPRRRPMALLTVPTLRSFAAGRLVHTSAVLHEDGHCVHALIATERTASAEHAKGAFPSGLERWKPHDGRLVYHAWSFRAQLKSPCTQLPWKRLKLTAMHSERAPRSTDPVAGFAHPRWAVRGSHRSGRQHTARPALCHGKAPYWPRTLESAVQHQPGSTWKRDHRGG